MLKLDPLSVVMFGELGSLLPIQNTSYSLEGDDLIIASLLRNRLKHGLNSSIFYLDIGASHPTQGSNTFLFMRVDTEEYALNPYLS